MQQHGTLRFAFDPGNGGSGATTCDWSYLADLHIARASQ
jgi:hypothetical protein